MKTRFLFSLALAFRLIAGSSGWAQTTGGYGYPSPYSPTSPFYAQGAAPAPGTQLTRLPSPQAYFSTPAAQPVGYTAPGTVAMGEVGPLPPPSGPALTAPFSGAPTGPAIGIPAGPMVAPGPQMQNSPYMRAMNAPWGAADCGPVAEACPPGSCPPPCAGPACPKWFGGAYGLIMNRACEDPNYFALASTDPSQLFINSKDANMKTTGGFEVRLGRTLCNCCYGLEFVYWELFPQGQCTCLTAYDAGYPGFFTTMDYRDVYLNFANGAPGNPYYTDLLDNQFNTQGQPIQAIQLDRSWNFRNIELNLLSGPLVPLSQMGCGGCSGGLGRRSTLFGDCGAAPAGAPNCGGTGCSPCPPCGLGNRCMIGWLFGVRYFRFEDYLQFTAENNDGIIDYNSPDFEFNHQVDVTNDLVGVQLGLHMDYCICKCLSLNAGSSFGIYGNNTSVYQEVHNGNGPAYTDPLNPQFLTWNTSDTDVAYLGELRAGLGYKVGCHWRLSGGYRVMAASCVGTALNQLPVGRTIADYDAIGIVNRNDDLVLHGTYVGAEFAW